MSLDWTVDKIENYETRCWIPSTNPKYEGEKRKTLNPETEMLIWATMQIDLPAIRVQTIDEWHFRCQFLERVGISWFTEWDGDKSNACYPTYDQIADHVGLRTNVTKVSRTTWLRKILRRLEKEIDLQIEGEMVRREKENNHG